MASITLTEIAEEIERKTGVKPNLSKNVIKALREIVADELADGQDVTLTGFVKFTHQYRPALRKGRMVRSPQTGETRPAEEGRPASIRIRARALTSLQKAAPSPTSKAGKPIADLSKQRAVAAAARKAEKEAQEA